MNGILLIDKPEGLTSRDVVTGVTRMLSTPGVGRHRAGHVRAGHLGTLDPMATGLLPVCVGQATRLGQFIASSPKEYEGEIHFGFSTDTYDREGVPAGADTGVECTEDELRRAITELTGAIDQVPPPFCAKKIDGVRSYKLARKGRVVENAPIHVEVSAFEVVRFQAPRVTFRVVCSGGTYIRSLAHDLGQKLGCGAHLVQLRRTRSGPFTVSESVPLDRMRASDLIPLENILKDWPLIEVSADDERKVANGNPIPFEAETGFARIFNKKGEFLAVAAVESGWAHPRVVLTSNAQ